MRREARGARREARGIQFQTRGVGHRLRTLFCSNAAFASGAGSVLLMWISFWSSAVCSLRCCAFSVSLAKRASKICREVRG